LTSAHFYLNVWSDDWAAQFEEAATQHPSLMRLSVNSYVKGVFKENLVPVKQWPMKVKRSVDWWEDVQESYFTRVLPFVPPLHVGLSRCCAHD
jgi:hypothetical protein